VIVRDEVEDVLFEIGAGGADGVDFVLTNHLGEGQAELGGAHGAGHGQEHFAALIEVETIGFGRVDDDRGIEVTEVVLDEFLDGHASGSSSENFFGGIVDQPWRCCKRGSAETQKAESRRHSTQRALSTCRGRGENYAMKRW